MSGPIKKGEKRIVFFDIETGGLRWWPTIGQLAMPGQPQEIVQPHPVIQIGAVAFNEDTREDLGRFEIKIKFDLKDADQGALKINGYDPAVWAKDGVDNFNAASRFKAFLDEHATEKKVSKAGKDYWVAVLAGHNVSNFDLPFLRQWMQDRHQFFPATFFPKDTMILAAICRDELGMPLADLKLATIAQALGIKPEGTAHDALTDSITSGMIYFKLIDYLKGARP